MFVTLDYSGMKYGQSFHRANILNSHSPPTTEEKQHKHAQQIFMRSVFVGVLCFVLVGVISYLFLLFAFEYCCVSKLETSNGTSTSLWLFKLILFFVPVLLLLFWINCCRSNYVTKQNICEWNARGRVVMPEFLTWEEERVKERMASILASMYQMMWKSYKLFEMNVLPDPFQLWSNGRNSLNKIWLCVWVCTWLYIWKSHCYPVNQYACI